MIQGIGLSRSDTIAYAVGAINMVAQLGRDADGKRGITQINTSAQLLKQIG